MLKLSVLIAPDEVNFASQGYFNLVSHGFTFMLNANIPKQAPKGNENRKPPPARNRHQAATVRSFYCAAWEENGTHYYADPVTGEKRSVDPNRRMRPTLGRSNGSPQSSDQNAALCDSQQVALETKLSSASPGLAVELSQSESLALIRLGNGAK